MAAVGVQCIDCVRKANRQSPRLVLRNQFGATFQHGHPVVTYVLIGLNVVSWFLERLHPDWLSMWAFAPILGQIEPWRFLTAAFLHDPYSITHIAFNMYALWIVGQFLEHALSRFRFLALYLLAAVGGTVMFTLFASPTNITWITSVVGASGAVFGLFGAAIVLLNRIRRPITQFAVILGINAVIGFLVPGIAWEAHLGGFLVGVALGAAFAYAPVRHRDLVTWAAPLGMAVILILGAIAAY